MKDLYVFLILSLIYIKNVENKNLNNILEDVPNENVRRAKEEDFGSDDMGVDPSDDDQRDRHRWIKYDDVGFRDLVEGDEGRMKLSRGKKSKNKPDTEYTDDEDETEFKLPGSADDDGEMDVNDIPKKFQKWFGLIVFLRNTILYAKKYTNNTVWLAPFILGAIVYMLIKGVDK